MKIYCARIIQFGALASIGLVTGCGNIATVRSFSTPYAEPSGAGDVAQIRVITNGMVRAVPGQSCINWRSAGAGVMVAAQKGFANLNNRDLQIPKTQSETKVLISGDSSIARSELRISANMPITLNFMSQGYISGPNRYSCQKSLSFVPKNGENYEAIFLEQGSQCLSKISMISSNGAVAVADVTVISDVKFCNATDNF
ncbi:hypothetical protein ACIPF8_07815 [Collimonas sp. NPDC087041]|uniref:hypothetical protein n=1 Tax=Collimonas sp. NPDC087041 TaxID=3363960 RepID=UPI003819061E